MEIVQVPFYAGTSGLVLPYRNQQGYPAKFEGRSRIDVYGQLYNSIEINSIFYKLPKAATVSKWAHQVKEDFKFTFKLWKQVSHSPGLKFDTEDIREFMAVINSAISKVGCILVQFPPSLHFRSMLKVEQLLNELQALNILNWHIAVEFRHRSWYTDSIYKMLDSCNAIMVYHDKAGRESPHEEFNATYVYVRFHGPAGDYKGSYDSSLLDEYATFIYLIG